MAVADGDGEREQRKKMMVMLGEVVCGGVWVSM